MELTSKDSSSGFATKNVVAGCRNRPRHSFVTTTRWECRLPASECPGLRQGGGRIFVAQQASSECDAIIAASHTPTSKPWAPASQRKKGAPEGAGQGTSFFYILQVACSEAAKG